jgi:hypothetical protein
MIQDGCRGSDSDIDYCGVYYVQGAPATSSPPTIITFECYWPETVCKRGAASPAAQTPPPKDIAVLCPAYGNGHFERHIV